MPIYGVAPLDIAFTDTSSGALTWLWYFGDGTTSTSQNPTHIYTNPGTYTVTLFITTADGTAQHSDTVIADSVVSAWTPPDTGPSPTGEGNPQVMLRISNDGGRTWPVPEMFRSAGKRGEYLTRVGWNRLGCARRRVFEVSVADPIQWRLTGAYLEAKPEGR